MIRAILSATRARGINAFPRAEKPNSSATRGLGSQYPKCSPGARRPTGELSRLRNRTKREQAAPTNAPIVAGELHAATEAQDLTFVSTWAPLHERHVQGTSDTAQKEQHLRWIQGTRLTVP